MIELYASYMALPSRSLVQVVCNLVIATSYLCVLQILILFGYARPACKPFLQITANSIQNKNHCYHSRATPFRGRRPALTSEFSISFMSSVGSL